jgi:hypothetical protein
MTTAIDLTRCHASHERGDLALHLTWWLDDAGAGPRPCMVLLPARGPWDLVAPCVVPLAQAWVWSETIGDPVRAALTAVAFAEAMGFDPTPMMASRIRSLIVDHLGDLLAMPPMPASMREAEVIGEAKVVDREAGTVVKHHEIVGTV